MNIQTIRILESEREYLLKEYIQTIGDPTKEKRASALHAMLLENARELHKERNR